MLLHGPAVAGAGGFQQIELKGRGIIAGRQPLQRLDQQGIRLHALHFAQGRQRQLLLDEVAALQCLLQERDGFGRLGVGQHPSSLGPDAWLRVLQGQADGRRRPLVRHRRQGTEGGNSGADSTMAVGRQDRHLRGDFRDPQGAGSGRGFRQHLIGTGQQGLELAAQGVGRRLGRTRAQRLRKPRHPIAPPRPGPGAEQPGRLHAERLRLAGSGSEASQGGGVVGLGQTVVGVQGPPQQRFRLIRSIQGSRQRRQRGGDRLIVDRTGRLGTDARVGILKQLGDLGCPLSSQRHGRRQPHRWRRVAGRCQQGLPVRGRQGQGTGVAQVGVAVGILAEQRDHRRRRLAIGFGVGQGEGREEPDPRRRVPKQRQQRSRRGGVTLAQRPRRLRPQLRIVFLEQADQCRRCLGLAAACQLPQAPHGVQPNGSVRRVVRRIGQHRHGLSPHRDQGKLRLLPHAQVLVAQENHQFSDRLALEPRGQQFPGLFNLGPAGDFGVREAINPALAGQSPAIDPIADVEAAVRAELAIGGQDALQEFVPIDDLK